MHRVNDMDNKCKETLVYLIVIFRYDTLQTKVTTSSYDLNTERW